MADQDDKRVVTPFGRVSFPAVFKPEQNDDGEDRWNCTLIFPAGTDLSALQAAADEAVAKEWGTSPPANLRRPFRDGGEKAHLDGYVAGTTFVRATSTMQPELLDRSGSAIINPRDFYAGCWARMVVTAFAYKGKKGRPGVSFGLRGLQKVKDDEAFGGGGSVADLYDDLPEDNGSAAPEANGNDPLLG